MNRKLHRRAASKVILWQEGLIALKREESERRLRNRQPGLKRRRRKMVKR